MRKAITVVLVAPGGWARMLQAIPSSLGSRRRAAVLVVSTQNWSSADVSQMLDTGAGAALRASSAGTMVEGLSRKAGASAQKLVNAVGSFTSYLRECIATWAKRRRDRLELLNYLAQDHRAAGDMGTSRADAEYWARQPFWRP